MDIRPCGSTPSRQAPAQYFTGIVWQDPIIEAPMPPDDVRATLGALRSRRAHQLAHPSSRANSLYYFRYWQGAERGREGAGSARR